MARGEIYKCEECPKEFKRYGKISKERVHRFCSLKCYWENMRIPNICKTCGKDFKRTSHDKIDYCSLECKTGGEWGKLQSEWHKNLPRERFVKMGIKSVTSQDRIDHPTSIEIKVYEELKNRGLLFEKQKVINGKFVVDAYIPSLNLVIECDGDYWHNLPKVVNRDKSKNAYLTKCGYDILRLKESEIRNNNFIQILEGRI